MKQLKYVFFMLTALMLGGCSTAKTVTTSDIDINSSFTDVSEQGVSEVTKVMPEPQTEQNDPTLLYMGQASIRIVTEDNKVIYIDPYAGDTYDLPADLILVTHEHYDHNDIDKVSKRNDDCQIITHEESVINGEHKTFELGYVTIKAVEAGYNDWHDVNECAGYVLTFGNGCSVYVTGDTSKTEQMSEMSSMNIDYAFYCCDGEFNMGLKEAEECARLVGAKHNIPYHNTTDTSGDHFDREKAQQFDVPNRLIIEPGEEINLIHQ